MTTLVINHREPIEVEASPFDSVLDILLRAQSEYWGDQHSINSLYVNGEAVEPLDEATLMGMPAQGAKIELELIEREERKLSETMNEARQYLETLLLGFEEVSTQIRSGGHSAAYTRLQEGVEGLSTILGLFLALSDKEGIGEELRGDFCSYVNELNNKLLELNEAQETQDPTLIADIIEYELIDAVKTLLDLLDKFRLNLGED